MTAEVEAWLLACLHNTPKIIFGDFFMAGSNDIKFMKEALELAAKGRLLVSPNPMVGALVVRNNRVVAKGYHRGAGKEHAEAVAIRKAGKDAFGATLYVNLEPCCHTGKTSPCVDKIVSSGISRVVYAVKDPDLRVSGKGARYLRKAGIEVNSGLLRAESERLNESFLKYHRTGLPFVIVKTAQTIDGRVSTSSGESRWISGEASLKYAHQLRAEVDAVVVGAGTVRADNPSLTVRRVRGRNPLRIILSTTLNLPSDCLLLKEGENKVALVSSQSSINKFRRQSPASSIALWTVRKSGTHKLDLLDFLGKAAAEGVQSILVEGGPTLATSFIKQGLADKIIVITAPMMIGIGVSSIGDLGISKLAEAVRFKQADFKLLGQDSLFIGYPEKAN